MWIGLQGPCAGCQEHPAAWETGGLGQGRVGAAMPIASFDLFPPCSGCLHRSHGLKHSEGTRSSVGRTGVGGGAALRAPCVARWELSTLGARWAAWLLLANSEVQTSLLGCRWSRKPRPFRSCPGPAGSGLPAAPPEGCGPGDLRLRERAHQARPALGAAGGGRARPHHPQLYPLSAGHRDLRLRCGHGGGGGPRPGREGPG